MGRLADLAELVATHACAQRQVGPGEWVARCRGASVTHLREISGYLEMWVRWLHWPIADA
jgi:hypothetical protein